MGFGLSIWARLTGVWDAFLFVCLLAICRLDPAASLHTPLLYIFLCIFLFPSIKRQLPYTWQGDKYVSYRCFCTLPFFKNQWEGKKRNGTLSRSSPSLHASGYHPSFLASSNPAPITYYVPFFLSIWKWSVVLSVTLHRKLCHHSSSICHVRNSNYV
jgi:hypothetical protein